MKKLLTVLIVLTCFLSKAQIIYSESFGSQILFNYSASNGSGSYTTAPTGFSTINDSRNNHVGTGLNPNTPFNDVAQKKGGWLIGYNALQNDTFLVSTSWTDTSTVSVNRWIITPPVTITSANTILRWKAMCPDINFKDGYEVYVTSSTSASLTALDFPLTSRLFDLLDNNTVGGGENAYWTNRSVSLNNYVGQSVRFAFRNNSKNRFQLWIDDIEVATIANTTDVAVTNVSASKYVLINTNDSVKVSFKNLGASTVFSLTLNYMVGNSSINSQTFYSNSKGWANQESKQLVFAFPTALSAAGYYKIKAWVSSVNGLADQNNANDTAFVYVTSLATPVIKNCLIEQFVSANNGDSPDAQERLNALQTTSAIVAVNIHQSDSMEIGQIASFINDYKTSFSQATFDRNYFADLNNVVFSKGNYNSRTNKRLAAVSPASVSIINKAYNSTTKELSFTVKADFVGEVVGDYRINAYLTENHIRGTESDTTINGYNQLNDYYSVPWSPYYLKGNFVPTLNKYVLNAWHYKHQNVLIHAFDSAYGKMGLIPQGGGTAGQSYQQTYTLTLPTYTGVSKFNPDNVHIVGFVAEASADKNKRTVLNSVREKLTANAEVIGIHEMELAYKSLFHLYPNPANANVSIALNEGELNQKIVVSVRDLTGRLVLVKEVNNFNSVILLPIESILSGTYFVEISYNGIKTTKKLIIQH